MSVRGTGRASLEHGLTQRVGGGLVAGYEEILVGGYEAGGCQYGG